MLISYVKLDHMLYSINYGISLFTHHSVSLALLQDVHHLPRMGGRVHLNFELCHVPSECEYEGG
jgi:hypothetical protein